MKSTLHRSLGVLFALALVGCINGLDEPTLVKTPRILAIVADRPEAAPGQDVHLSVMAFDPMHRELHYAFRMCIDTSTLLGGSAANGSGGMMAMMPPCQNLPSTGEEATMPGAMTQALVTIIDNIPASSGVDAALLHHVLDTAGLPLTVEVNVTVTDASGGETVLVSGSKLVGITTRATPTTNPPFVFFRVITEPPWQHPEQPRVETTYLGGADPDHPFDCVPWVSDAATAIVSRPEAVGDHMGDGEHPNQITLSPADDPTLWEESFPIYDFNGMVRTGHEGSYYSWYSTASLVDRRGAVHSALHTETTQGPSFGAPPSAIDDTIRDNTLDVPREPGTYDMWVVVRDGHLGTVGCHFPLVVTAAP